MTLTTGMNRPAIDTLAALLALIAHSQIVMPEPTGEGAAKSRLRLLAGFDDVDIAVLEWIAAEGRRCRRGFGHH